MANLNVNKVIYGGDVLIDLTGDSVSADKILKGITAHDKSGAKVVDAFGDTCRIIFTHINNTNQKL